MSGFDGSGLGVQGPGGPGNWRTLGPQDGAQRPQVGRLERGVDPASLDRVPLDEAVPTDESTFASRLSEALRGVDHLADESTEKAEALARGEPVELHELMVSMEKSDVAFRMMLEVRNKLLDAWQTLTRTPI